MTIYDKYWDISFRNKLQERVFEARKKHSWKGIGRAGALAVMAEELGEVAACINKDGEHDRFDDELLDYIAVGIRALLHEYE